MMATSFSLPQSLDPYSNRYFSGEFNEFSRISQDFTRKVNFNYYHTIDEEEEEKHEQQEHEPEEEFEEENEPAVDESEVEQEEEKPEHEPEEEFEETEPIVDESEEEFSFPLPILDESPISAGESFQIQYPIFDQSLLHRYPISTDESLQIFDRERDLVSPIRSPLKKLYVEEERESVSQTPPISGPYCDWSPESCKKSNSTGFSKIWKLRDMVVHRSNSDGDDAFVFMNNNDNSKRSEKVVKKVTMKNKTTPSSQEVHYVRNREVKRRSFLPYRQGLIGGGVGFFTSVNGLTRNVHPY